MPQTDHRFRSHPAAVFAMTLAAMLQLAPLPAAAVEQFLEDLTVEEHMELGKPHRGTTFLNTVDYSNVTNFLGQGFANGGSALQGANRITRLVMDDITPTGEGAGQSVIQMKFSVANFNAATVTVRPRVRFWEDNAGLPGAYYSVPLAVGFSFAPLAIGPGVTVLTANLTVGQFTMPGTPFWAGVTFDDNGGTTGITQAQLDLIGQGIFFPADIGTTGDIAFQTTSPGSFFNVPNPAGALFNFGGNPELGFGWEFTTDAITPAQRSSWGRIRNLYR